MRDFKSIKLFSVKSNTNILVTLLLSSMLMACVTTNNPQVSSTTASSSTASNKQKPDEWIDATRLKGLAYWSGLFEEYKQKKGYYPLQDRLDKTKEANSIIVKFASAKPLKEGFSNDSFKEVAPKELMAELSEGLGRPIEEKFIPVLPKMLPNPSPIGYFYFATPDGYLIWTPCELCEISEISTYLMDGHTVTLNIASEGMIDKVTKAQTREDMLNHPKYKKWLSHFEIIPANP